jgi:nitroreductase
MKKAVNTAMKTPTACNRQMCKVYFVKDTETQEKILHFSHGLTGFDNKTVNIIVVTYDISSLCFAEEIQQGMFNAGLFSMNLVNSLHSIGIGSCFLEYSNDIKDETEHKKILNIPSNEKIAIVIAAGYYPEESTIPYSTRKPLEEIYRER